MKLFNDCLLLITYWTNRAFSCIIFIAGIRRYPKTKGFRAVPANLRRLRKKRGDMKLFRAFYGKASEPVKKIFFVFSACARFGYNR